METKIDRKDKIRGGLVGLLVGDALGVPYEFHHRQSIPPFAEIEFEPPENFRRAHRGVPVGTWSDDGAQALVLLESLLTCGKFSAEHFAEGLVDWYENGFMAVDERVFDVGIQTADAIINLRNGISPLLAGGRDERANGNGSLMRVLPLALASNGTDAELVADAFDQSALTHAHPRSQICCAIYSLWARRILQDVQNPWESALETFYELFPAGSAERIEFETHIFPPNADYELSGNGYVVNSLRAARWANRNNSFEATVKAAVSLGEDTDTTACIAGGIAGLRFGFEAIPERWRKNLRGREIYVPLLEKLIALG